MDAEVSASALDEYSDRLSWAVHNADVLASRLKHRRVRIRKGFVDARFTEAHQVPQAALVARAGKLHLPIKLELLTLWAAGSKGAPTAASQAAPRGLAVRSGSARRTYFRKCSSQTALTAFLIRHKSRTIGQFCKPSHVSDGFQIRPTLQ